MNPLDSVILRVMTAIASLVLSISTAASADSGRLAASARDLAASLSELRDGVFYVRLRLEVKQPDGATKMALQIQIRERRTQTGADVVYQVLWPSERKGEALLLHQTDGRPPAGWLFIPPAKLRPLDRSEMNESLFGSDLSYEDIIENFFAWENQSIVGHEAMNGVNCTILESRPGSSESSTYGSVRSWIDLRRLVPLRVEKYLPSGQLTRRIETTRVVTDDRGRSIPGDLIVRGPRGGSVTELDGSRIRHDVAFADSEFTPEGLREVSAPHSATP
jgi:hypothetical protein